MKLVNPYPSYYTGVLKFVNTYIFLPLALTCTFFFSCRKIIHPRKPCRAVSRVRTVSRLKTFFAWFFLTQLTAWTGSPYRNRRLNIGEDGKRGNGGRNGYPSPLNIPSWPFFTFSPLKSSNCPIYVTFTRNPRGRKSTHWHLSVKNACVSPHMTSYFVIIATNRQEIIPFYLFPDIRWFGLQDCLFSWLHFRVLKVSWVVN